jgi:hypothetical protein
MTERVPYVEAGKAHRLALKRAISIERTTRSDWKVLSAALALTASYSKLTDRVGVAQVAAFAGVNERTRGSLKKWSEAGVLVWHPKQGGRGINSTLSLPQPGASGPVGPVSQPGDGERQPGDSGPEQPGDCPPITEKVPREVNNREVFKELTPEDPVDEEKRKKVLALLKEYTGRSWSVDPRPLDSGSKRESADGSNDAAGGNA